MLSRVPFTDTRSLSHHGDLQTFGQVSGFDNKDFFHFVLLLLRNRTHFYIKFMMQFFLELTFLVFFLLEIKYFVSLQMVHRI